MVASLGNWFGEWVFSGGGWSRLLLLLVLMVGLLPGCSVRQMAINKAGDALASSGTTFAADDDPELIREALPFGLKTYESLLAESPGHRGLLLAAAVLVIVALMRAWTRRFSTGPTSRRDELVKDPVCQTYVVRSRAVTGRGADGAPYFCSTDCARRYSG